MDSAQALCNFLRLDMPTFYKAVRGLHSVIIVPESKEASRSGIRFHHASFLDFLFDPLRSGKFVIHGQEAVVEVLRSSIYWHDVDVTNFHARDGWDHEDHGHDSMPGLTWASEDNRLQLSQSILTIVDWTLFLPNPAGHWKLDIPADDLYQMARLNFRYWPAVNVVVLALYCQLEPSTSLVRTEPATPTDHQLLEYFHLVTGNGVAKPAIFPLRPNLPDGQWTREFFFIGHDVKSAIIWRTKSPTSDNQYSYSLRCDMEPSEAQISKYQEYLQDIGWDEEKAQSEMK